MTDQKALAHWPQLGLSELAKYTSERSRTHNAPSTVNREDLYQFHLVQERSILLPSTAVSWDLDNSFRADQRHQHDKSHVLWKKLKTVVMLDEQVRRGRSVAAEATEANPTGRVDRTDLDLFNSMCYHEGEQIPWELGTTVVTPPNGSWWNLNMEASLAIRLSSGR
ncbi:hypothetical protein HRG_009695 [Hirsutella rhossiliensis]|uniref:Uncharacterized protein n=1 Tax=Hirsutella rhossiliensis TaxID=111463 RepID=A0A9P8MRN5_9HYPO|nr:uncharacterized protein HRG_09695 [Hirsutella rhossiliensis]KAH0959234.1 hypothetical protein HRG_09695 [Hirsutella rhossiliensis]